jgi:hypothetical protein
VVPSTAGLTFTKICSTESYGFNIASAFVATFEACIGVCAGLNFWNQNANCLGAAYSSAGGMPVNCWAHNGTASRPCTGFVSAFLVT